MKTDVLREWAEDQSGLTTVWAHQNAPRPSLPFVTLDIINVSRVGQATHTKSDADGNRDVIHDREATVSAQVYSNARDPRDALERAADLRESLDLATVRQRLIEGGWAVRGYELLTSVPDTEDTLWESRAVVDIRFGTTKQQLEDAGLIEKIEVTANVRDTDYSTTTTPEVKPHGA